MLGAEEGSREPGSPPLQRCSVYAEKLARKLARVLCMCADPCLVLKNTSFRATGLVSKRVAGTDEP